MTRSRVVILGGGPAGCGAAFQLRRLDRAEVTLVEKQTSVGGNAGSFPYRGLWLDFGSHRLHAACDPTILADIRALLGNDLADRPRHGRIRLRGEWLHFPIQTGDLLRNLDRQFAAGLLRDMVRRMLLRRRVQEPETFATVLLNGLGPTMCRHFYFPYARKIWGREAEELSAMQAFKRVSAGSFSRLVRRLIQPPGTGRFYYPREGYGQISRAYAQAAVERGAELLLGWGVETLERLDGGWKLTVSEAQSGVTRVLEAQHAWSTIPIPALISRMRPPPPPAIQKALGAIQYRAMILAYLELEQDRFTSTDAHYFPEEDVRSTRISEPKNYFGLSSPSGRTVLCAELPCSMDDALWTLPDEEIGRVVSEDLARSGLPLSKPPVAVFTRRLPQAYPIYPVGYETALEQVEAWLDGHPGLLRFGRQALFAHDNTHHALFMAYCAVDCLVNGTLDRRRWDEYRAIFATHVVED